MKTTNLYQKSRKGVLNTMVMASVVLLSSCCREVPFLISSVVPSAQGSVEIKRDKSRNYTIDLRVIRLVDPLRLTPPRAGYVVWMDTSKLTGHGNTV